MLELGHTVIGPADFAVLALIGATVIYAVVRVYYFIAELGIVAEDVMLNSDVEAQDVFLRLIEKTDASLVIHDDGDDDANSIYNAPRILEALQKRIEQADIHVQCFFNCRESLEIEALAKECPANVVLYYRDPPGRPSGKEDIHYKIVDDGKFLHLSKHGLKDSNRRYKLWDATNAWKSGRRRRSRRYRNEFRRDTAMAVRA